MKIHAGSRAGLKGTDLGLRHTGSGRTVCVANNCMLDLAGIEL